MAWLMRARPCLPKGRKWEGSEWPWLGLNLYKRILGEALVDFGGMKLYLGNASSMLQSQRVSGRPEA